MTLPCFLSSRPVATIRFGSEDDPNFKLDRAYRLTNSIDSAWVDNPEVETFPSVKEAGGARSTSVNDLAIVTFNGEVSFHRVDNIGWSNISVEGLDIERKKAIEQKAWMEGIS